MLVPSETAPFRASARPIRLALSTSVMLVSANAPEWGMTYFGVLKAGATCIPCDPESSTSEILNFARAGNACGKWGVGLRAREIGGRERREGQKRD